MPVQTTLLITFACNPWAKRILSTDSSFKLGNIQPLFHANGKVIYLMMTNDQDLQQQPYGNLSFMQWGKHLAKYDSHDGIDSQQSGVSPNGILVEKVSVCIRHNTRPYVALVKFLDIKCNFDLDVVSLQSISIYTRLMTIILQNYCTEQKRINNTSPLWCQRDATRELSLKKSS